MCCQMDQLEGNSRSVCQFIDERYFYEYTMVSIVVMYEHHAWLALGAYNRITRPCDVAPLGTFATLSPRSEVFATWCLSSFIMAAEKD